MAQLAESNALKLDKLLVGQQEIHSKLASLELGLTRIGGQPVEHDVASPRSLGSANNQRLSPDSNGSIPRTTSSFSALIDMMEPSDIGPPADKQCSDEADGKHPQVHFSNSVQSPLNQQQPYHSQGDDLLRTTSHVSYNVSDAIFHASTSCTAASAEGTDTACTDERLHTMVQQKFLNKRRYRVSPRWARVADSRIFNTAICMVIVANTLFMAVEADTSRRRVGKPPESWVLWVNQVFAFIYISEIAVRLAAFRCGFFVGDEWRWNAFDSIIVATAVYDQVVLAWTEHGYKSNVGALRVLRVLKMVKMLRLVRVLRSFRELRVISLSVIAALRSTLWALGLIVMMTYLFALVFMQGCTLYLSLDESGNDDTATLEAIDRKWDSIGQSMVTLFEAGTGGEDWFYIANPLHQIGYWYHKIFLVYIFFFYFVVTNILTSLFVDSAIKAADTDESSLIAEQLHRQEEHIAAVRTVFQSMDKDADGAISMEEFTAHLMDDKMLAFAAKMEVEPVDLLQFFKALSNNGKRTFDLETFVLGCIKLRGSARSVDLMHALMAQKRIQEDHDFFRRKCELELGDLHTMCVNTHAKLDLHTDVLNTHATVAADIRKRVSGRQGQAKDKPGLKVSGDTNLSL